MADCGESTHSTVIYQLLVKYVEIRVLHSFNFNVVVRNG